MALRDVTIRLGLNSAPFVAGVKQAQVATTGLANDITKTAASGSKSAGILGGAFGPLSLAVVFAGAKMVAAAADFDQAMSNVEATGKDAAQSIGSLRKAAIEAGAATKYSATEAAGGIEALAKAGVSSADVLGGGLKGALSLAAAGNLDVAGSAEAAASAMNQFGLKGKDVPHIADLLAAGAGKAQGEVSDMAQALNQAGLIAHGAGASIEETTGTLAAFASAGLVGSDAGTSFKTMLQRLQVAASPQAAALMKQYGINAYDAQGKFAGLAEVAGQLATGLNGLSQEQRAAALATIFGSDAVRAANVLYKEGRSGIEDWTSAVDDSGYAADVAKTKMDNLRGDLEKLSGTFDTLFISSGSGAQSPLRGLTQALDDLLKTLGTKDSKFDFGNLFGAPQVDVFTDLFRRGRARGLEGETGVDHKVIYRIETLGADAAANDIAKVAKAADLTPKQIRSVLTLLGWKRDKIDEVVNALTTAQQNARIRAQLRLLGFNTEQIDAVTDALSGTQSKAKVKASLTLAGFSPKQIQVILSLLGDVGKQKPNPKAKLTDNASPGLKSIKSMLLGLDGQKATVTVTTVRRTVTRPAGGGALEGGTLHGFADGGYFDLSSGSWAPRAVGAISGPGTDTSDSIPAMLSNGEHVLTASDVRKLGGQDAVFRLRSAIQAGDLGSAYQAAPPSFDTSAWQTAASPLGSAHIRISISDVSYDAVSQLASMRVVARDEADRVVAQANWQEAVSI